MIVKGDTPSWTITLFNAEGDPLDLSDHTVTVTFRVKPTDAQPAFQHFIRLNPDGTVDDSHGMALGPGGFASGVIIETMTAAESALMPAQDYKGDLEVRYGTQVHTPLHNIKESVKEGYTNAAP